MKSVELELKKRFLVVESENANEFFIMNHIPAGTYHLICKGSELTGEKADDLVHGFDLGYFVDYNHHNPRAYKLTAMESFISAIESKGYYWGENPLGHSSEYYSYIDDEKKWQEAESRTFNKYKTIIFEIL